MLRNRRIVLTDDRPWWLAGGVNSDAALWVYQPAGASDINASYGNVANSTQLLTSPEDITWNPANGWTGNGSTSIFAVGANANSYPTKTIDCSWIARINPTLDGEANSIFQFRWGAYYVNLSYAATTAAIVMANNSGLKTLSQTISNGIFACAGENCYINGVLVDTLTPSDRTTTASSGAKFFADRAGANRYNGSCQAVAFYNFALTQLQVASITRAMNAL